MPEIKNTFTQGKMNKDLDERIIPSGEYRDALNIKVTSSGDASIGTVQNILGNKAIDYNGFVPSDYLCIATIADEKTNKLYWFVTKELIPLHAILQYDLELDEIKIVLLDRHNSTLKFTQNIITGINIIDNLLFWTDNYNEPKKINIEDCIKGSVSGDLDTAPHTVLLDENNNPTAIDIQEQHITVIKRSPRLAPQTIILPNHDSSAVLFEKVFPRFSYRYKYKDGEYSSFGPFTDVIFKPIYKEEQNIDNSYSLEEGNNTGMVNNIKAVQFSRYKYENLPKDVVQIELLYKEEGSPVVFSVKKINNDDYEWTTNNFVLESQDIFAAIPSNQLLRPWDNVPLKALSQEVTGNRIVYGNYTQGRNLISSDGSKAVSNINVNYEKRNLDFSSTNSNFDVGGVPSLKSQRDYSVGLVWGDKYGRETPVMDNTKGVTLPWFNSEIDLTASNSTSLAVSLIGKKPHWADYYKFYIKEKSGEYYNLLMEKAYFTEKVNIFDLEDERIWLGFISADRNKISEDGYITLKKKIGASERQVRLENKFKVLDIQNEAPDAIKYKYVSLGEVSQVYAPTSALTYLNDIFTVEENRPTTQIDMLYVHRDNWVNGVGGSLQGEQEGEWVDSVLYASWKNSVSGETSERYKIISSVFNDTEYMLKLDRNISEEDAALAKGDASGDDMSDDLKFKIEKRDEVEPEEFSGKFFVQISSLSTVQPSQESTETNYMISSSFKTFWLYNTYSQDIFGSLTPPTIEPTPVDGITGHNGSLSNEEIDYASLVSEVFNDASDFPTGRGFFIDTLYMAGGQPSSTNYAKSTGRSWQGRRDNHDQAPLWGSLAQQNHPLYEKAYGWGVFKFPVFLDQTNVRKPLLTYIYDDNGDSLSGNNGWEQGQVLRLLPNVNNVVQSMEGILTTSAKHISSGPDGYRRFRTEGNTSATLPSHWNGSTEFTYGNEPNVHYIEISFMAPGVDLHDGEFPGLQDLAPNFGNDSIGAYLQAIWGGGVFNDVDHTHTYPNDTLVIEMEGNYDLDDEPLAQAPGPGIGYGYDNSSDYATRHNKQWDPTYPNDPGNKIQLFIQNIKQGAKFIFSTNPDVEFEILANPKVKKIYNHTLWNRDYVYQGGSNFGELSKTVQREVLQWARATSGTKAARMIDVKEAIENFGKANNRRVTYIFPVDKNIFLESGIDATNFDATNSLDIQFKTTDSSLVLSEVMTESAIWETEPKQEGNLDIYYEASQAYPTELTNKTNVEFAPIGSVVEILDIPAARNGRFIIEGRIVLVDWENSNTFKLANKEQNGFNAQEVIDGTNTDIDYVGGLVRFYRKNGSYTTARITGTSGVSEVTNEEGETYTPVQDDHINKFTIEEIDISLQTGLGYHNCFSFGNGIESNRIRDDFNSPTIKNGVKASLVLETEYKEEKRKSGLIFSGIYNSNSGVNNLNQFIMAENITKDLNPTYGSIQKLFQRRISLVALCEDRIVSITSNKDSLFNADGNSQLVSTNAVLGDATPFVGDFGISKNPESFAKESYRAYFADKQRGAVLRLSMDGLTAISDSGMNDYFRDELKLSGEIIGSYDAYSKDYNITLRSKKPSENYILNAFLNNGATLNTDVLAESNHLILNGEVNNSTALVEPRLTLTVNNGNDELDNRFLFFKTTITNHDEIPQGDIVDETQTITTTPGDPSVYTTSSITSYHLVFNRDDKGNPFKTGEGNGYGGNDKKYTVLRNYTSDFVTESNAGTTVFPYMKNPYDPNFPESGNWYTGLNPSYPNSQRGPSEEIFWNPIKDGYNLQAPSLNESPFGTTSSHRNPWFNTTTSPNSGHGIVFDKTSQFKQLYFPGDKITSTDIVTPPTVLVKYPTAVPTTVFNGEEVRITIGARGLSYVNPNSPQTGTSSDHWRYLSIHLYDGTTALTSSVIMDPANLPGTVSQSFADYNYVPVPGTSPGTTDECRVGFQITPAFDFPVLEHNTSRTHDISFKFTNGVDEAEEVVVQDLQIRVRFVDEDGNEPNELYGSIEGISMQKRHYLSDVSTPTTTTTTNNGDPTPPQTVPAWAEVNLVGYTYWVVKDDNGNVIDEEPFSVVSPTIYGTDYISIQDSFTNNDGVTSYWLTSPDGGVSNGSIFYDDGSSGAGMFANGDQLENDKFNKLVGDDIYLSQPNTTVTGNMYAIALMNIGASPTGDVPVLENYNEDFVQTMVHFDFEPAETLVHAYLCIFEGDDTISDISIKLPANAEFEMSTINMIDISATWSGGTAPNWTANLSSAGNPSPQHAYDLPQVYASDSDGIVFNVPGPSTYTSIRQTISNLTTIPGGYVLSFFATVTSGALNFRLLDATGNGPYGQDVIDRTGAYRINLNMGGGTYDVEIDENANSSSPEFSNATFTNTGGVTDATPSQSATNMLLFHDGSGCQGTIDNISLVNAQDLFSGGSADDWIFDGFNQILNNFIVFNNGQIQFHDCPGFNTSTNTFCRLTQGISQTTVVGERYKVRFDHNVIDALVGQSGGISGYYYTTDPDDNILKGFEFGSIIPTTSSNAGDVSTYSVIHTIGESVNPSGPVLVDTLVIYADGADTTTVTNGYIDNILFRQEFVAGDEETISFSESVRGWTSRKSFVPEQGVSLSSSYFTFNTGNIYQHNVESEPRNQFYGVPYASTITTVMNTEPSTVKSFNTLNYEGSQSNVDQFEIATREGNDYNTLASHNLVAKPGWKVNYIKTDKQEGSIKEFLEKEGKWFNYIKGSQDTVDTGDLSFQGLGIIKEVE